MNEELKRCPFCGASDPYYEISEDEVHSWIACGNCFATSSRIHKVHGHKEAESWNTRPIEDELRRKFDELNVMYQTAMDNAVESMRKLDIATNALDIIVGPSISSSTPKEVLRIYNFVWKAQEKIKDVGKK